MQPLQDPEASACVRAEREVNRALGGSCTIPLGAYAQKSGDRLRMRALVASPDGKRIARAEGEGDAAQPEALGLRVAKLLRERGAAEILAALGA
jgi:hydroxymethylbilane synthase